ncbi:MAG TPA: FAD synthetase family protein [Spirochaetia bacterium]|nr:FAD synthetase family protein [Spirochaetia bacterium]
MAGRQRVIEPVRLTIGAFDGLHLGHRELMETIVRNREGKAALVVTFSRNPAQLLSPSRFPGLILSYRQKLSRLSELGADVVVAIDFSDEMSNLSGKAFIGLLKDTLTIEKIVVGENFRFGRSREAGSGDLKEMLFDTGIEVLVIQPILRGNEIVSSSRIRKTIQEADFAEARAMLLADYCLDLREVAGYSLGGGLLRYDRTKIEQVVPRAGHYTVGCLTGNGQRAAELTVGEDSIDLAVDENEQVAAVAFH